MLNEADRYFEFRKWKTCLHSYFHGIQHCYQHFFKKMVIITNQSLSLFQDLSIFSTPKNILLRVDKERV